jgi:hypothetical protein
VKLFSAYTDEEKLKIVVLPQLLPQVHILSNDFKIVSALPEKLLQKLFQRFKKGAEVMPNENRSQAPPLRCSNID